MSYARLNALNIVHTQLIADHNELKQRHDELVNDIFQFMPECWNDDVAAEALIINFLHSVVDRNTQVPGHVDGCMCFS